MTDRPPQAGRSSTSPATAATAPARAWRRPGGTALLLAAGLLVQLVPLFLAPGALTQDGAAHVAGAWVLDHSGDAGPVGDVLRRTYTTGLAPVPNLFTTLVLAGLLRVVGPDAAERLLVAAFVVALVLALAWALRAVDRRAGLLAAAALPLAGGQLAAYGFYNFCWGVVGALLVLGLALRRQAGWSPGSVAGLAALLVLTWSAHLLPFAVAAAGAGLLALARARADGAPGRVRRHVLPVVLAGLPAAALTAVYLASGSRPAGAPVGGPSPARVVELVTGVHPLVAASWWEVAPAVVTVATVCWLALRGGPARGPRADRLALTVLLAGCALGTVVVPDRLGTDFGYLPERLSWFPLLLLVLLAAAREHPAAARRGAVVVLVLASGAIAAARLPAQLSAARDERELLSLAGDVAPGSTLVLLRYARSEVPAALPGPRFPDPLRHAAGRLAVHAGAADVGLYEAATPYFQVAFTPDGDLWRLLDPGREQLEQVPPAVDLAAVRGRLDYVVVVGRDRATPGVRAAPATAAVQEELRAHYRRVATSSPTGFAELWRASGA